MTKSLLTASVVIGTILGALAIAAPAATTPPQPSPGLARATAPPTPDSRLARCALGNPGQVLA